MTILAWVLLVIGALPSVLITAVDLRKSRSREPYCATGLWQPEVHVLLALLTGGGAWILWGWLVGVLVFLGQAVIGMFLGLKVIR